MLLNETSILSNTVTWLEAFGHQQSGCFRLFLITTYFADVVPAFSSVQVGESPTAGVEEVTFLYQLAEGACPKSYGTNVAKLAGMPDAVLARAAAKSAEVERTSDELTAGSSKKSASAGDEREPPLDALEKELFDRLTASLKGSARLGASRELVEVWQEAKRASVESPQLSKRRRVEGEEPISRTAGVA